MPTSGTREGTGTLANQPTTAPAPAQTFSPVQWSQLMSALQAPTVSAPRVAPTYFGTRANAAAPESVALAQMRQIDPTSEALRQQLAASYATPLAQAGGTPSAAQLRSYLNLYGQIDPAALAGRQALSQQIAGNLALGSQLDPQTAREVEQATRAAQGARGNVYGTPQMVQEAMTRGQAGLALQAQRQAAAQGYYQSGVDPGALSLNLYQGQLANLRQAQAGAQSYLGSGVTPYQAGAGYLTAAQGAAAAATQGGPTYQAGALGSPYSYMNPQAGNQMSQTANQWYQSMLYGQAMSPQAKNRGGAAAGGALSGALSGAIGGATIGSAIPGVGTLVGAGVGALGGGILGGASGYMS